MEKSEIKAQAEAFCAKPRVWRKSVEGQKAFAKLSVPVQGRVREMLEARRGFRRVNGNIEFSKAALEERIERLGEKYEDTKARLPLIKAKIGELKAELAERFGEDNKE